MSGGGLVESHVELAALEWFQDLGYAVAGGPAIAPGELLAERADYAQVVLERGLRDALATLNPGAPADALDEAFKRLSRPDSPLLLTNNRAAHRMLLDGIPVQFRREDGSLATVPVAVMDFADPAATTGWPWTCSPWSRTTSTAALTS